MVALGILARLQRPVMDHGILESELLQASVEERASLSMVAG